MVAECVPAAVMAALDAAVAASDWDTAAEAAWVVEMLGMSRRLCAQLR